MVQGVTFCQEPLWIQGQIHAFRFRFSFFYQSIKNGLELGGLLIGIISMYSLNLRLGLPIGDCP